MKDQIKPLHLKIVNREDVIYEGDVNTVSSTNETGNFDVLRKHANFISLIKDRVKIKGIKGEEKVIKIGQGIMKVRDDKIDVFLGIKQ